MDKAYGRYKSLMHSMETDAEFLWLQQQRETLEPRMQEVFNELSKEQQEILTEYFGICQEVIWRVVELACFLS